MKKSGMQKFLSPSYAITGLVIVVGGFLMFVNFKVNGSGPSTGAEVQHGKTDGGGVLGALSNVAIHAGNALNPRAALR